MNHSSGDRQMGTEMQRGYHPSARKDGDLGQRPKSFCRQSEAFPMEKQEEEVFG